MYTLLLWPLLLFDNYTYYNIMRGERFNGETSEKNVLILC